MVNRIANCMVAVFGDEKIEAVSRTPDELLKRPDGYFARLSRLQQG